METMLYKYPATESHLLKVEVDGDVYHYQIVTDDLVDAEVEKGWHKHFVEAKSSANVNVDLSEKEEPTTNTRKKRAPVDGVD